MRIQLHSVFGSGSGPRTSILYLAATSAGASTSGTPQPPNQHYIDSQPEPGLDCGDDLLFAPRCQDAAFTAATGDKHFDDDPDGGLDPGDWVDNFTDDRSADGLWHFGYDCLALDVNSLSGHTGNSEALPSDLTASATIVAGQGCAVFDYNGGVANQAPTAVAQARPTNAIVGDEVTFDGSGSSDDRQASEELSYSWTFGDGASATGQTATHAYSAPGSYVAVLTVTDAEGLSDTDMVTITVTGQPDLQVTNITANNNKNVREGDKVTISATIKNGGSAPAAASKTEFLLDGSTVLGLVDTPALATGASATVSVQWDTRSVKGDHQIKVTADKLGTVTETNENNNAATLTVTVQGNKVKNGSFEQANAEGNAPANWSASNTGAGTTSWSEGGSDGSKSASASGNGGSVVLNGSPAWTSDPIAVGPGQILTLRLSVKASGTSSAANAGLAYLGPAGELLNTVTLITAPLTTNGFNTLEQTVTVPTGVVQVQVVLKGFAPADLATAGTVAFDDVGLYGQ